MVLEYIIGATVAVSLVSLIGIFLLLSDKKRSENALFFLVSFAGGTFLAAAFLDLLPEALEVGESKSVFLSVMAGILAFFVIEKLIRWHHHHSSHQDKSEQPVGYLNLVGDAFHNFFDGIAISASFIASPALGVTTTFAVLVHEIPQELGDFSLLVYSGFSRKKALFFNLLSGLFALFGAVLFYFFSPTIENIARMAVPFTAGMFIYMAGSDIFPELSKETNPVKSAIQLALILFGIATIYLVKTFLEV